MGQGDWNQGCNDDGSCNDPFKPHLGVCCIKGSNVIAPLGGGQGCCAADNEKDVCATNLCGSVQCAGACVIQTDGTQVCCDTCGSSECKDQACGPSGLTCSGSPLSCHLCSESECNDLDSDCNKNRLPCGSNGQQTGVCAGNACTNCQYPYYCVQPGSNSCNPPPLGYYSDNYTCEPCPAHTYNRYQGGGCSNCPSGQDTTLTGQTSCTDCSAGTYSDGTGNGCLPCALNYYNPYTGKGSCLVCPSGSGTTTTGQTSCTACSVGTYSDGTGKGCLPCPLGTYNPNTGQSRCLDCLKNMVATTTGQTTCVYCQAGYGPNSDQSGCVQCTPDMFSSDSACTYCQEGWGPNSDQSGCVQCNPDMFSSDSACTYCQEGYEPNSNQSGCVQCPSDKYAYNSVCAFCNPGQEPTSNQAACQDCPQGSVSNNSVCAPCSGGTVPNSEQTLCIECSEPQTLISNTCYCLFPAIETSGSCTCPLTNWSTGSPCVCSPGLYPQKDNTCAITPDSSYPFYLQIVNNTSFTIALTQTPVFPTWQTEAPTPLIDAWTGTYVIGAPSNNSWSDAPFYGVAPNSSAGGYFTENLWNYVPFTFQSFSDPTNIDPTDVQRIYNVIAYTSSADSYYSCASSTTNTYTLDAKNVVLDSCANCPKSCNMPSQASGNYMSVSYDATNKILTLTFNEPPVGE